MTPYDTGRAANGDWGNVGTRDDLIELVTSMHQELLASPGEWENGTLERFLEAFAAVVHDVAEDDSMTASGWQQIARLFLAATGYE